MVLINFLEDNDWDLSVDEEGTFEDPQNPAGTPFRLYMASKLLANNKTWEFWATAKPKYALVTLHPSYVYGHNPVQTSSGQINAGTNWLLWNLIMTGEPGNTAGVHIQDVVEAHIKALDPRIVDGSKYLLAAPNITGPEIARIVKKLYPDSGALITEATQCVSFPIDTTKAETELGIQWRSWEAMVRDVMDQQLGFL